MIFAWDELKKIAAENLDAARRRLMDILCNYAGYRKCVPILVFDAYRVKGAGREQETWHNLHVIYTREAETADMFIERATHELAKTTACGWSAPMVRNRSLFWATVRYGYPPAHLSARCVPWKPRSANFWTSKGIILHPSKRRYGGDDGRVY